MAALIEVRGGAESKGRGREIEFANQQSQQGLEIFGEIGRTKFRNAEDPGIAEWAAKALEKAGGNPNKAGIIACVPVENAKEWELNVQIGRAVESQLMALGMPEANISIIVEAMDFSMLSRWINPQNWKAVQQRLAYATDEEGTGLAVSGKIPPGSWQALKNAASIGDFRQALSDIGSTPLFFPNMEKDGTITWLYDEMRKASVGKEKEKMEAAAPPPETKLPPVRPKKERILPIAPPMPVLRPPERPPPTSWLDASVGYAGGMPISSWPPGSIFHPPLSTGGNYDPGLVNKVYTLNNLLGIHTPLQSLEQLKKDQEAVRNNQLGSIFNDAYFGSLRQVPASYASRLMKELFDAGAQIKLGQLEENEKFYFFSSIPMLPIRGHLPLMDGVAFSLYHCNMIGSAWTKDWMLKNSDKAQLTAKTDIRVGMIYSDRSLSGSPAPKSYKPAALGLKLMDSYKTTDVLPDFIPIGMLDARIIYRRELSDKVSVSGTLTLSGVGSMVNGGWPAMLFEGEASLKKILDGSFAALDGGTRVGWNVPAMRLEELSAYLVFKPKDPNLPSLSFGASETSPLKGRLTNVFARLEESIRLSPQSSIGAYVGAGATLYPRTSDLFSPERATNLEFGISWRGILEGAEQGE